MAMGERQKAAKAFVEEWAGHGYEKGQAQVFWTQLLQQVVSLQGIASRVKFEYHAANGGFIDCWIPDSGVLIEQKALGIDLDKPEERQGRMVTPYQQALAYAQGFPLSQQPRFIVVCNFETFRVHDRDKANCENDFFEFTLDELGSNPAYLGFITDPANSRSEKERQVSMQAGALIGKLFDQLRRRYIDPNSPESQHALNVLCVRLVFCLYCEDAGLFEKDAFLNYMRKFNPSGMRNALRDLFVALDTPVEERDPYTRDDFKGFPYVNGGLFHGEIEIPSFDDEIRLLLLLEVSQQTDWSQISPTIFGGIFESTLNPETRRTGGMHYTSPESIHKVIDPLFLNDLRAEFDAIRHEEGTTERKRHNALKRFHRKLCELKFLDPACGSGNFLTETFLCLRQLEDDVLNALYAGQTMIVMGDEYESQGKRVSLAQFYGIEINDFAVSVAETALWIARLQANNNSAMLLDLAVEDFPLTDKANIVEGNALRMDWNDVLPAGECSFIMGNPPFVGAANCAKEQKREIVDLYGKIRLSNSLDYVSGWYYKACAFMMAKPSITAAFVSTNSITQGEQVHPIWHTLQEKFGIGIRFAWSTFYWASEASDPAHVHCVIIGFQVQRRTGGGLLFNPADNSAREVDQLSPYLRNLPPAVLMPTRMKPLCKAQKLMRGDTPTDDGNFVFTAEEKEAFVAAEPQSAQFFRRYIGAKDFLHGGERWCLWLLDAPAEQVGKCPNVLERVRRVRDFRAASSAADTRKRAEFPLEFFRTPVHDVDYLAVPKVSSERRRYLPAGYFTADTIPSDSNSVIPNANLYVFGIFESSFNTMWARVVAGRLKSDYRYTNGIVYNNFVWPGITRETLDVPVEQAVSPDVRLEVERCAQAVLDARAAHPESTLADMYDPDNDFLFPDLMAAHRALDAAVEAAYGVDFNGDEEKVVAHLFNLYARATEAEA